MQVWEYRVVAAPRRARRIKGVSGASERFAATVAEVLNEEAARGWEFVRAETLPQEERTGVLRSKVETLHSLLVFRRPRPGAREAAPAGTPEVALARALRPAPALGSQGPGPDEGAVPRIVLTPPDRPAGT